MTNSRDWENGGLKLDRRGVGRDSPSQQESNVMTKKFAIAVVALLAGALMLPNHEALARGGGEHGGGLGGGGFHGGALGGGFHGASRHANNRHASTHMSSQEWGGPTAYPGLDNLDWDDE